jgi:hypothetical protein
MVEDLISSADGALLSCRAIVDRSGRITDQYLMELCCPFGGQGATAVGFNRLEACVSPVKTSEV